MPIETTPPPNEPSRPPEAGNARDGTVHKLPPAQEGQAKESQFAGERKQPNVRPGEVPEKIKSSAGEE